MRLSIYAPHFRESNTAPASGETASSVISVLLKDWAGSLFRPLLPLISNICLYLEALDWDLFSLALRWGPQDLSYQIFDVDSSQAL